MEQLEGRTIVDRIVNYFRFLIYQPPNAEKGELPLENKSKINKYIALGVSALLIIIMASLQLYTFLYSSLIFGISLLIFIIFDIVISIYCIIGVNGTYQTWMRVTPFISTTFACINTLGVAISLVCAFQLLKAGLHIKHIIPLLSTIAYLPVNLLRCYFVLTRFAPMKFDKKLK